ncbi:hypothetical protein U1Q18_019375 [Sarracenia purpurea var. burkii]
MDGENRCCPQPLSLSDQRQGWTAPELLSPFPVVFSLYQTQPSLSRLVWVAAQRRKREAVAATGVSPAVRGTGADGSLLSLFRSLPCVH